MTNCGGWPTVDDWVKAYQNNPYGDVSPPVPQPPPITREQELRGVKRYDNESEAHRIVERLFPGREK